MTFWNEVVDLDRIGENFTGANRLAIDFSVADGYISEEVCDSHKFTDTIYDDSEIFNNFD